jgi:hypothetical protein
MIPHTVEHPYIHFNGTSGYSRHGDTVSLFAERIENLNNAGVTSGNLSLQLWACQSPYTGGSLTGRKLAEFPLGVLRPGHSLAPVNADVPASFPESGDFAIALVIAEWDGEGFNLIHDFHNYPCRDLFLHPRLEGAVGYRCVDDKRLVVDVERIHNPRDPNNMSGTLSLELWALPEPYIAGDFGGHALGAITLGSIAGGTSWQNCAYDMEMVAPPADTYTLVLMLREWTGNSYVTRDHCNFSHRVTFPIAIAATQATETLIADEPLGQVAQPAKSFEQTGEVAHAGPVGNPANEVGPLAPQDIEKTRASRKGESAAAQIPFENLKRFAQRLWEWLREHW